MRSAFFTLIPAILLFATGCTGWAVSEASTAPAVIASHPNIRLLKFDGTVLSVDNALFRNDSIVGLSGGAPIGIARADVKQIAVRKLDGDKTAGAVVAGAVVGAVALVVSLLLVIASAFDS